MRISDRVFGQFEHRSFRAVLNVFTLGWTRGPPEMRPANQCKLKVKTGSLFWTVAHSRVGHSLGIARDTIRCSTVF